MAWQDKARRLTLSLTPGSRMRAPLVRNVQVRVAGSRDVRTASFSGRPVTVTL